MAASGFTMNTRAEKWLDEHEGKLVGYYSLLAAGTPYRQAFAASLCPPDVIRLREKGLYDDLLETREGMGSPEDGAITRAIDWLEETELDYPEGHPIWRVR